MRAGAADYLLKPTVWWADMDIQEQLVVWQEYHRKLEKLSTEWFRL